MQVFKAFRAVWILFFLMLFSVSDCLAGDAFDWMACKPNQELPPQALNQLQPAEDEETFVCGISWKGEQLEVQAWLEEKVVRGLTFTGTRSPRLMKAFREHLQAKKLRPVQIDTGEDPTTDLFRLSADGSDERSCAGAEDLALRRFEQDEELLVCTMLFVPESVYDALVSGCAHQDDVNEILESFGDEIAGAIVIDKEKNTLQLVASSIRFWIDE
ncbi:MAG: hypothetical protein PUB69_00715 [Desulfovibrionaceae bacterium]|nr:hypothetical protein [Desulfovibrionaceae bacterium]